MEIPLRDGIARVDDDDAALVAPFVWHSMRVSRTNVYAYTTIAGRRVYMHHLILNRATRGRGISVIDHRNGDGLDNRRANLRPANNQQNSANRSSWRGVSGFKGVSWNRAVMAWQTHIMVDRRSRFLGYYEAEEDAAHAYDLAALAAFDEYARLNLPDRIQEPAPVSFSIKMSRARAIPDPTATAPMAMGKERTGASNGRAKLAEAEVRQIIAALQAVPRRTQADIAREFGVAQAHVSRIAQRKSWAYLWPT